MRVFLKLFLGYSLTAEMLYNKAGLSVFTRFYFFKLLIAFVTSYWFSFNAWSVLILLTSAAFE
jgi:hypothetical protein